MPNKHICNKCGWEGENPDWTEQDELEEKGYDCCPNGCKYDNKDVKMESMDDFFLGKPYMVINKY